MSSNQNQPSSGSGTAEADSDEFNVTLSTLISRSLNGTEKDFILTATIAADELDDIQERRAPVDLICLVDTSKSMSTGVSQPNKDKLGQVMNCFSNFLRFLGEEDRLSIYQFAQRPQRIVDAEFMTKEKRLLALTKLQKQTNKPDGSSNLMEALRVALADLASQPQYDGSPTRSSSIWIFSDGLDTESRSEKDASKPNLPPRQLKDSEVDKRISSLIAEYETKIPNGFTVNTFGFGEDHDDLILSSMAEHGHGCFYFVNLGTGRKTTIYKYFADCMNRQLSAVIQKGKAQLSLQSGSIRRHLHSYHATAKPNIAYIGQMYSGQQTHLFFDLIADTKTLQGTLMFNFSDLVNGQADQSVCVTFQQQIHQVQPMPDELAAEYSKMREMVEALGPLREKGLLQLPASAGKNHLKIDRAMKLSAYTIIRNRCLNWSSPSFASRTNKFAVRLKGEPKRQHLKGNPTARYFLQKGIDVERAFGDPEFQQVIESGMARILVSFVSEQQKRYETSLQFVEKRLEGELAATLTASVKGEGGILEQLKCCCVEECSRLLGEMQSMCDETMILKRNLEAELKKSREYNTEMKMLIQVQQERTTVLERLAGIAQSAEAGEGAVRTRNLNEDGGSDEQRQALAEAKAMGQNIGSYVDFDEMMREEEERAKRREAGWTNTAERKKSKLEKRKKQMEQMEEEQRQIEEEMKQTNEQIRAQQAEIQRMKEEAKQVKERAFTAQQQEQIAAIAAATEEKERLLQEEIAKAEERRKEREAIRQEMLKKEQKEIKQLQKAEQSFNKRLEEREERIRQLESEDEQNQLSLSAAHGKFVQRKPTKSPRNKKSVEPDDPTTEEDLRESHMSAKPLLKKSTREDASRTSFDRATFDGADDEDDDEDEDNDAHGFRVGQKGRGQFERDQAVKRSKQQGDNELIDEESSEGEDEFDQAIKTRSRNNQFVEQDYNEDTFDNDQDEEDSVSNEVDPDRTQHDIVPPSTIKKTRAAALKGRSGDSDDEEALDRELVPDDSEGLEMQETAGKERAFAVDYDEPEDPIETPPPFNSQYLSKQQKKTEMRNVVQIENAPVEVARAAPSTNQTQSTDESSFLFKFIDKIRYSTLASVIFLIIFIVALVFFVFLLIGGLSLLFGGKLMAWPGVISPITAGSFFGVGGLINKKNAAFQVWTADPASYSSAKPDKMMAVGPLKDVVVGSNAARNGFSNTSYNSSFTGPNTDRRHMLEITEDSVFVHKLNVATMQLDSNEFPEVIVPKIRSTSDTTYTTVPVNILSPINTTAINSTSLSTRTASATSLTSDTVTTTTLVATGGTIDTLNTKVGTVNSLSSTTATIDTLTATDATIDTLTATDATIAKLAAQNAAFQHMTTQNTLDVNPTRFYPFSLLTEWVYNNHYTQELFSVNESFFKTGVLLAHCVVVAPNNEIYEQTCQINDTDCVINSRTHLRTETVGDVRKVILYAEWASDINNTISHKLYGWFALTPDTEIDFVNPVTATQSNNLKEFNSNMHTTPISPPLQKAEKVKERRNMKGRKSEASKHVVGRRRF
ncbi:hypothetical protein BLNAU_1769 [Blattamonas nauphoetae]|uniref:VWFA domain-containing protein n=1 Tax=Blattamonas nauphoetae TaxID=2049346 RepID=A0ABQ9YHK4_9EUKA|nr:hypothetical protein BLNAU_1769 [Blattamonas nauphoetae]